MAESSGGGSVAEISLSVEETNKLRAKLGLKPLQVDNSSTKAQRRDTSRQATSHAAASDAGVGEAHEQQRPSDRQLSSGDATVEERRRAVRAQREKLEEAKRKATHATFTQGLTIAEQQQLEDDDCDPAAWIARMRRKELREKLVLASQGKCGEESFFSRFKHRRQTVELFTDSVDVARYDSDEEEGSSPPRTAGRRKEDSSASRRDDSGRKEAASMRKRERGGGGGGGDEEEEDNEGKGGLRVVHGLKEIQEGEDVILTLQDTRILTAEGDLNEDIDALESVQLMEKQRLEKRLKTKARQTVYDPTAEEEEEEIEGEGERKRKDILKHYDEWEEEQLQAQGKASRKEQSTGFILPNVQEHGMPDVVEVPVHRLKAPDHSQPGDTGGVEDRSERRETREGEGVRLSGAGIPKKGIQYDASGPSSVVLGQEVDVRKEEEAEKPVTFRKLSKKKISKKTHGSDFWKDLFGDSLANRNGEEEAEEGEAERSGDEEKSALRHQKKDRHHGSRKGRSTDEADRRGGAQQKQSVREALDRASESAHKQRAESSFPSTPSHSSSSRASKDNQRRDSGAAAPGEEGTALQRRRRGSEEFPDGDALPMSTATAAGEGPSISLDDEMLLEEDRLLQEHLERQRRLARAKLLEQDRLKLKSATKEEEDEDVPQSSQGEDDAAEDKSLSFRKLPQARLLELLSRAQRGEAALIDARPTDAATGAESSLRNATRNSSAQQQNNRRAATSRPSGSASVGLLVKGEEEAEEEEEGGGLQISTTTEFCRTVQTPLEKLQTMKQEVFAGARLFRQQKAAQTQSRGERGSKAPKGGSSGASSVAASGSRRERKNEGAGEDPLEAERRGVRGRGSRKPEQPSEAGVPAGDESEEMEIEEENVASGGVAKEKQRRAEEDEDDDVDELEDVAFMNETPMGQGIADTLKYLQSKNHYSLDKMRQRRHRPDELPLHKPIAPNEIKIDHRDMYGNVMTPKDAFRQISWRFHGKYPSLNKQEKQARKMHLERKLLKNPMEALPTLNALQKLQQTEKTFHMVLTGGSLGEGGGSR